MEVVYPNLTFIIKSVHSSSFQKESWSGVRFKIKFRHV